MYFFKLLVINFIDYCTAANGGVSQMLKIKSLGIIDNIYNWIEDWLKDRVQRAVTLNTPPVPPTHRRSNRPAEPLVPRLLGKLPTGCRPVTDAPPINPTGQPQDYIDMVGDGGMSWNP